jgi:hypothetical protein
MVKPRSGSVAHHSRGRERNVQCYWTESVKQVEGRSERKRLNRAELFRTRPGGSCWFCCKRHNLCVNLTRCLINLVATLRARNAGGNVAPKANGQPHGSRTLDWGKVPERQLRCHAFCRGRGKESSVDSCSQNDRSMLCCRSRLAENRTRSLGYRQSEIFEICVAVDGQ